MGFCVYFHKTWTPGYNSEIIDPNLAYSYQKKVDFLKKIAWWIFVLTLIICVIILLSISGGSRPPNRSDQIGCPCRKDSFLCHEGECIHQNLVCDTVKDCSNGNDEVMCTAISSSLTNLSMNRSQDHLEGYVLVRVKGSWHPYCSDLWSTEMGDKICRFLGYPIQISLDNFELDDLELKPNSHNESTEIEDNFDKPKLWYLNNTRGFDTGPLEDAITIINHDSYSCNVAYIKCSRH